MSADPDFVPVRAPRHFVRWALLGAIGLLLAALALVFGQRAATARRVEAALAEIRDRGEPATVDQLNAYYAWPAKSLDCTQVWIEATQPFDGTIFWDAAQDLPVVGKGGDVPPPGRPWPAQADVEAFLQQHETSLQQMHAAADRGGAARYPHRFQDGIMTVLPYVHPLKRGACVLALEAHVRAHRGDAAGAADSIHAIFKLAGSLENEPILVSQLMRMSIDRIADRQIESLLPHVDFSDDDLRRWRKDMDRIDNDECLRRALVGSRAIGLVSLQDAGGLEAMGLGSNVIWRWTKVEDMAIYLDFANRMVAAADRPWPAVRDEAVLVDRELQTRIDAGMLSRLHTVATEELVDSLDSVVTSFGEGSASNDAADAALAVELFRRGHGRLPESLAELTPDLLAEVPLDRFNGQPLRYVVRDGECLIYSVGSDGVDGGGDLDGAANGTPTDVGFRLIRSAE